ncbi:MAG: SH3 domain-containing protein [Vicinamibacterales bacterium]
MSASRLAQITTAMVMSAAVLAAQDGGAVKITVPRANVRSEASEKAPVLTQVTSGTVLVLVGVEGDWFHVRLPMGGLRIDAWVSKKVATLVPPVGEPAPTPVTPAPAAAPPPAGSVDGMSVALASAGSSAWMTPHPARIARVGAKLDALTALAGAVPAADAPAPPDKNVQAWAWIVPGGAADRVLEDRRPTFAIVFKDVPGVSPDDLTPLLVRLTSVPSGGRLIAASRGSADLQSRTAADWDPGKDLKQDVVKSDVQIAERGAARLQPAGDLPPGQYAIVLRPTSKKKLAGATVLSSSGEGRVLALAWDFAVR